MKKLFILFILLSACSSKDNPTVVSKSSPLGPNDPAFFNLSTHEKIKTKYSALDLKCEVAINYKFRGSNRRETTNFSWDLLNDFREGFTMSFSLQNVDAKISGSLKIESVEFINLLYSYENNEYQLIRSPKINGELRYKSSIASSQGSIGHNYSSSVFFYEDIKTRLHGDRLSRVSTDETYEREFYCQLIPERYPEYSEDWKKIK